MLNNTFRLERMFNKNKYKIKDFNNPISDYKYYYI